MVKEAMGWGQKKIKGMDEILKVEGAGRKGLNILIWGKDLDCLIYNGLLLETKYIESEFIGKLSWRD